MFSEKERATACLMEELATVTVSSGSAMYERYHVNAP